jgi:NADPH-dependent curcumin reductase CurA
MTVSAQRFVLESHPVGEPTENDFRLEHLEVPDPRAGQIWFARSTCRWIHTFGGGSAA